LIRAARERGLSLTGPDGLLKQLTKTVIETSLNEEMTKHLGYEKHDPVGPGTGNIRNGTRSKMVLTENTGGGDRGLARSCGHVRTADRAQAAATAQRRR
jgi:hypothetical protein